MDSSPVRDMTNAHWLRFPTASRYFSSRLDDVRVMPVFVTTHAYESMHEIGTVDMHWVLSFVKRGLVHVECMGKDWIAHSGDLMIFPPYVPRSEIAETPGLHEYMFINATVAERLDLFRFYPVAPIIPISAPERYSQLFSELTDTYTDRDNEFWGLYTLAAAMKILATVLTEWRNAGSPLRPQHVLAQDGRFAEVIAYMHEHLTEKISREGLAVLACLHPVYLDRAFKDAFGLSTKQMLREMRLHKAKDLLETTSMTLGTIADSCGLGTSQYLNRVFHRRFNVTPNEHRKSFKEIHTRFMRSL